MNNRVTRASSADRERYVDHLPVLHELGYISQEQVDTMAGQALMAETLAQLDNLMDGFPKPAQPRHPRDWGIPRNFLPVCASGSMIGLTLAIGVSTALSRHHGDLAAVVSALSILWGVWITIISVFTAIFAGISWDDLGSETKKERRRRDSEGR